MSTRWIFWLALVGLFAACGERANAPIAAASTATTATPPSAPVAPTPQTNGVLVAYLRGAEVQAENDQQRSELRRVLSDLVEKPASVLLVSRYAGPGGEPGQSDLAQVLRRHLVPASPQSLDVNSLIAEKDTPEVSAELREKLNQVERSLQVQAK